MRFDEAFAHAYSQGLQRRYEEEREKRQREEDDKAGEAARSLWAAMLGDRNKAALAPYEGKVNAIADTSLSTAIEAALGGGTDQEKQIAMAAGERNIPLARVAQEDYNLANAAYGSNPIEKLQGVGGRNFLRLLPAMLQLDQRREVDFEQQMARRQAEREQAERKAQLQQIIANLPPDKQNMAGAMAAGVPEAWAKLM